MWMKSHDQKMRADVLGMVTLHEELNLKTTTTASKRLLLLFFSMVT